MSVACYTHYMSLQRIIFLCLGLVLLALAWLLAGRVIAAAPGAFSVRTATAQETAMTNSTGNALVGTPEPQKPAMRILSSFGLQIFGCAFLAAMGGSLIIMGIQRQRDATWSRRK